MWKSTRVPLRMKYSNVILLTFESWWHSSNTLIRISALKNHGANFLVNGKSSSMGLAKVTALDNRKVWSNNLSSLGSSCAYRVPATIHHNTFRTERENVLRNLRTPLSHLIFFVNSVTRISTSSVITLCMVYTFPNPNSLQWEGKGEVMLLFQLKCSDKYNITLQITFDWSNHSHLNVLTVNFLISVQRGVDAANISPVKVNMSTWSFFIMS